MDIDIKGGLYVVRSTLLKIKKGKFEGLGISSQKRKPFLFTVSLCTRAKFPDKPYEEIFLRFFMSAQ
jgi:hypothetical protein